MRVLFVASVVALGLIENNGVNSFVPSPFFRSDAISARTFSFSAAASPGAEEEVVVVMDADDDAEVDERTYQDYYDAINKVLGAKKRKSSVVVDVQTIFDEMYDNYILTEDASLWPNVTIYNLLLDAHAWSPNKEGGEEAQHILDRMEDLTIETIARPDVVSYMHVMEGWANRNAPDKAQAVMDRLEKRFDQTASPDVKPDAKAYNKVIGAWMKSDAQDKAEQAEQILNAMTQKYEEEEDEDVLPNQKSFVQVMRCYGNRKTEAGLAKVRELLESMKKLHRLTASDNVQPGTFVYNELISSIVQNKGIRDGAQQAEGILYEMMEAANMGNDALEPNAGTFRHVIYGYKGNPDPGVAYKVEKLLELSSGVGVEINAGTYNAAIQVIAWTREPEKGALCAKLVQRMKEHKLQPTLSSYNNVLNACAHTMDARDPKELFRTAIEAFNEVRDHPYIRADVTTYGHFLRCCSELLPDNPKKDSVVKNVFMKCCNDGQVGRFVLTEFVEAGSEELVVELLGGKPGSEGIKIPRKWSQNVRDRRQLLRP